MIDAVTATYNATAAAVPIRDEKLQVSMLASGDRRG